MKKHKHSAGTVVGGIGFLLFWMSVSCIDSQPLIGAVGTLVGLALALVGARRFEREGGR